MDLGSKGEGTRTELGSYRSGSSRQRTREMVQRQIDELPPAEAEALVEARGHR